jgi:predicted lipoprotein
MARTGGEGRGWALIAALAAIAVLRPLGCGGTGKDAGGDDVTEAIAAVLADTWPEVLDPALARAEGSTAALQGALDAWVAAERAGDGVAARAAAQEAWVTAFGDWQQVEVLQLGPLGSSLTAKGGMDLRDRVYSWPTVNPCGVDQETVAGDWRGEGFFAESLVTVTGFDALETLLFSAPGVNACPSQVDINADGSWDALGEPGVQLARAEYAAVLGGGVADTLAQVRAEWEGGYRDTFARAEDPYESAGDALNASFDALFYLETATKDAKLGEPLGLRDCGADTCPVEAPASGRSERWLAANLAGGRALFVGGDGQGFDDLLRTLGHEALVDEILAAFDDADAAAAAMTGPVDVDVQGATATHAALDALCDLLREDLATALVLEVPTEAAGDND